MRQHTILSGLLSVAILPPFIVSDNRILPEQEAWRYAHSGGIEMISNLPDQVTEKILSDLLLYRDALETLWPVRGIRPEPHFIVVLCDSIPRLKKFIPDEVEDKLTNVGSFCRRDSEGTILVLPMAESPPGAENLRKNLLRSYYSEAYISNIGSHVPAWLNFGLSRLFGGFSFHGNIGVLPPLLTDRTIHLRANEANLQVAVRRGDYLPIAELIARKSDLPRSKFPTEVDSKSPGAKLNIEVSGSWADECYEFVHMCLLGNSEKLRGDLLRYGALASNQSTDIEALTLTFKMTEGEILHELWNYKGIEDVSGFEIARTEKGAGTCSIEDASDGTVGRIRGEWLLQDRRQLEAHYSLIAPYVRGSREPDLLAILGLQEIKSKQLERARSFLEAAVASKTKVPAAYAELASLKLEIQPALDNQGRVKLETANDVTELAKRAIDLGDPTILAYFDLAEACVFSEKVPTADDVNLWTQGRLRFPREFRLRYAQAVAYQDSGLHEEALKLVEEGIANSTNINTKENFLRIKENLTQQPYNKSLAVSGWQNENHDGSSPIQLPRAYSSDALRDAILRACHDANVSVRRLLIDSSAKPYLIGVVCSEQELEAIIAKLPKIYQYQSCGDKGDCRVIDLTPIEVEETFPDANDRDARGRRASAVLSKLP